MTRRGGHLLFWLVLTGGLTADLLSKHFVFRFLRGQPDAGYDVWPGVFMLSRRYNTGGPFCIFAGHNTLLIAFTLVALAFILYLYLSASWPGRSLGLLALAMIGAGALGNLVDRIADGQVRDFLNFYVIRYPVFNVADILITVAAGFLVIALLRQPPSVSKPGAGKAGASD